MRTHRLIRFSALAVMLVVLVCGFACRPESSPQPNAPGHSESTPSANLAEPIGWIFEDGKRASVSDYTGRVLLLDFYATWCEPCRHEMPHLVALHHEYEAQGLRIVGLNVGGEDDYEQVPAFKQEFGIPFPLAIPDADFVDRYLGVNRNIPQSFVIDRNGRIIKHYIGFSEARAYEIESVVQAALNE